MGLWTDYTKKDTPEDNDTLMLYDAAGKANKQTLFSGFWKWVAKKLKEATLSDLETTNKTMIGAINELNSNRLRSSENIASASDLAEDVLIKCNYGEIRLFTIQSTVSVDQGSPDGRGGFLLAYKSTIGNKYGIVVLFSYAGTICMKIKFTTWKEWKKIQLS